MSSLTHKNIKTIVLYILIGLFAYSVAGAVFKIMEERTVGSIFRNFLPTTPYLFIIVLISFYDIRKPSLSSLLPSIPSRPQLSLIVKRLMVILPLGILASLFALYYFPGLLVGPVVLAVLTSLFLSCNYMITGRPMLGILIFIGAIPFLFFIQGQLYTMDLKPLIISEITVPISAIFLSIVTTAFIFGGFQRSLSAAGNAQKRFIKLCIFFVSMPLFSILLSIDPFHSFIYYLLDLLLPFLFFVILIKSINNMEDIVNLILALIAATFLYQIFCLYFMHQQGDVADVTVSLYGSKIHTGFSATLIPLIIPFQLIMYKLLKGWRRRAIAITLIIFVVYLFLSNYRTAIAAAFLGFCVFYLFYYRTTAIRKFVSLTLVSLIVVIILIYGQHLLETLGFLRIIQTIQEIGTGISLNRLTSNRYAIWTSGINMISDHPLFGIGPDMWARFIPQYSIAQYFYRDLSTNQLIRYYSSDPHNLYLLIWLNYGVVNFLCYLTILYVSLKKGMKNIKKSSSDLTRNTSVGIFISLFIWMVMSFFTIRFFNHSILLFALIFWSIIAIILKINEFNSKIIGHR